MPRASDCHAGMLLAQSFDEKEQNDSITEEE
jgi:hypothetical protein